MCWNSDSGEQNIIGSEIGQCQTVNGQLIEERERERGGKENDLIGAAGQAVIKGQRAERKEDLGFCLPSSLRLHFTFDTVVFRVAQKRKRERALARARGTVCLFAFALWTQAEWVLICACVFLMYSAFMMAVICEEKGRERERGN